MSSSPELRRSLTFFDGAALLVGSVIGSGIFVVPSLIAQRVPEPGLVIGIWIFSGILVLCGALTLAELGTMLPQSGGLYVYMREAYGTFWAFLYGWTIMLVVIPGSVAALVTAFLLYLQLFVPMSWWVAKALGIAILLGLAWINVRGVKQGAGVQNLFTILKVSGLAALIALAAITLNGDARNFLPIAPSSVSMSLLTAIGLSMISTLFAYDGWQFVSLVAGEIRDPQRNIPRSIVLGVVIVMVIYVSANLAYIFVLGQDRIASSERVAADAMSAMVGPAGATFITITILCSTLRGHVGKCAGGPPRVLCHGARRRVLQAVVVGARAARHAGKRHLGARRLVRTADADRWLRAPDHDVPVRELVLLHDGRVVSGGAAAPAP